MLLQNKICFITGAGKGIGRATLERFVEEGAQLIYANDIEESSLDSYCSEHVQVVPLYFDVSDTAQVKQAFLKIKKESGRLDVLVNNAGMMQDALIGTISRSLMERLFAVNVFGTMELLQLASKLMMTQKSGSIINLSSVVGITGNPGQLVYSATKGAIISLTKTAAKELAPKGIRVNAIAPGMIDTDMMRSIGEKHLQTHLDHIPLGRLGEPREIADACVFLASNMSSYITGHIVSVDASVLV
ncbi:SDR family NAD(P)-dependent oxidoreductase [Paenibacillus radicis (ex Gao et al. 2016)]|uniref:3-oxoacyl-[acyl-carrier-protein] reductase FabG n=1 Tax=Paenibacillus radicis (ex Gao et al. 2016) TaxID=1737354 RepID=A0A917HAN4_9BACL|nr:SDR family NAD(P)-dependent oxidoreductase [Paenibacillus radicis (ex Gao et al. 2016)]GGG71943.1 3-oxoacyl-[acyl-carrier-protein] reductase FabG [Paenibacillus radicis (ex Gao et al. 2016)]